MSLICLHSVGVAGGWVRSAGAAEGKLTVAGAESTRLDPVVVTGTRILDLAASYAVLQHVWRMRNLRVQMKIDNLLNEEYEEACGFSTPGISV